MQINLSKKLVLHILWKSIDKTVTTFVEYGGLVTDIWLSQMQKPSQAEH